MVALLVPLFSLSLHVIARVCKNGGRWPRRFYQLSDVLRGFCMQSILRVTSFLLLSIQAPKAGAVAENALKNTGVGPLVHLCS